MRYLFPACVLGPRSVQVLHDEVVYLGLLPGRRFDLAGGGGGGCGGGGGGGWGCGAGGDGVLRLLILTLIHRLLRLTTKIQVKVEVKWV